MNTTPNNEAAYDRELIARMLDVCGHPMFTLDAYREQARLLRAADNASASAETVSRKPADAEVRAPSYDALLLIAQSVCGALQRAGVTDCDDPGEAIDVLRERYEERIAALSQQPEARGVVDDAMVDLGTHRAAWRRAIEQAISSSPPATEDMDDAGYWRHELVAFDRTFSALTGERNG